MGLLQVRASIQPADIVIIWASWMGLINILMVGPAEHCKQNYLLSTICFLQTLVDFVSEKRGPLVKNGRLEGKGDSPVFFFFQLRCTSALGGEIRKCNSRDVNFKSSFAKF